AEMRDLRLTSSTELAIVDAEVGVIAYPDPDRLIRGGGGRLPSRQPGRTGCGTSAGTAALVVRQQPDAVFGGWGNLVRAQPAAARIRADRRAHPDCHPGLGAVARGPGAAAASDRMGRWPCAGSTDARLGAGTAAGTVDPPVGRLGRGVGGFPILRHTADAFLCSGSQ